MQATQGTLPPGPRAPRLLQTMAWFYRPTLHSERLRARYGRRFTTRILAQPPIVVHWDPEHIKAIFTAPADVLHPGEGARLLEPVVGPNSVILLDEGPHLEQRKLLLPAFHGDRMQRLSGLMEELTDRQLAGWPTGEPVTLHPRLQRLTMEIILRAVFGLDEGARLDALRDRLGAILAFGDSPVTMLPPLQRLLSGHGRVGRFERDRAEADRMLQELMAERRAAGDTGRDDILATLLTARHDDGSPMSDAEIRDELMTALVAGHETTASSLAFAFEELTRQPAVQERIAGGDDEYLTATIHEVLRRKPVLPNPEPRLVKRPFELDGYTYPPGVVVMANAQLVHHDPDIYPEPFAFRPERFLGRSPGTYTWIPFGGGRRRCLGASFALLEMRVVLRAALERFAVQPVPGAGPEPVRRRMITITPARGATVVLRPRTGARAAPVQEAAAA